jgi:hypothetical protein
MGIAGVNEIIVRLKLIEKRLCLRPEPQDLGLPGLQRGGPPRREILALQAPEKRRLLRRAWRQAADRHHAHHFACRHVTLLESAGVKPRLKRPIEARPQRAVRQGAPRPVRQWRPDAQRIHQHVEHARPTPVSKDKAALLRRRHFGLGLKRRACLLGGLQQQVEQRSAMHPKPHAGRRRATVAHVQNDPFLGHDLAEKPRNGLSQHLDPGRQADPGEHMPAHRLQDQARPERLGGFELVEDNDPVARARKKRRKRQPCNPGPCNPDLMPPHEWLVAPNAA